MQRREKDCVIHWPTEAPRVSPYFLYRGTVIAISLDKPFALVERPLFSWSVLVSEFSTSVTLLSRIAACLTRYAGPVIWRVFWPINADCS